VKRLVLPQTADIVIIGAGATGCSIASHLLRVDRGLSVVLVDRHHVGAGSTSRSTAAFRHQWSIPAHVSFSRYAAAEYDRLAGLGFPIQFRRNGYLFLFVDEEVFQRAAHRVKRQKNLGVEGVQVLRSGELDRLSCGRAIDTVGLAGATWGPSDGFLDPIAVAQAYLEEARNRGLRYLPWNPVTGLTRGRRNTSITGVRLGDGHIIRTTRVVNAAGVWSPSIAGLAGLVLPLRPAKRFLYHSRPLQDSDVSDWPLVIGARGAHVRPSEGNTLMMAWGHRPPPLADVPPAEELWEYQDVIDRGFDLGPDGYGVEILTELSRHIPLLADRVGLVRATCGWYAVTPDQKAILGEDPRLHGLFHATGFSGHGIMHAAASGLTMAEIMLGAETTLAPRAEIEANFGLNGLLEGSVREPVEDMVL
jgi:glycine/D-amino acid oxidase-like deaminating enzyme